MVLVLNCLAVQKILLGNGAIKIAQESEWAVAHRLKFLPHLHIVLVSVTKLE